MLRYLFTFTLLAGLVAYFLLSRTDSPSVDMTEKVSTSSYAAHPRSNSNSTSAWGPSPFAVGTPTAPDQKALINRRRQRMVDGGYTTPEKYFHMGVKELKQLGDSGDVFAMLQLGERYWSEVDALVYDPDMDFSERPQNIALRYFMLAVRGGAGNVTAVVAKRMFDDGNIIDAAAWDMIAHKFGQNRNDQFFAAEGTFGKLSYEQMTAAQQRGKEIAIQMGLPLFE